MTVLHWMEHVFVTHFLAAGLLIAARRVYCMVDVNITHV
jgi:hypothetical protein